METKLFYYLLALTLTPVLSAPAHPHIIVLLADDLGYNDVSWHNQHVLMPHLHDLATSGIILEQHYSQAVCSPTRGAFLTGRYPINTGLNNGVITPNLPIGLNTRFTLLPQELSRAGYKSHIVGKWHLGFCNKEYWPESRGFDSYYGLLLGGQTYFDHSRSGGFDWRDGERVAWEANGTYSTTLIQERSLSIIADHDPDTPLFLYVPFQAVHGPLQVPLVYRDMYQHVEDEERRTYLGMITAMDDAVGNITQALKDSGLYDDSVILWFSDNGGPAANWPPGHTTGYAANNWPLRGSKFTLFEGGTRTPALIHSPSLLEQGVVTDHWLHVTDWYPTILSMAGLNSTQHDLDGLDHWHQLQHPGARGARDEMIYNIFYPTFAFDNTPPIAAIRKNNWKYIKRTIGFAGYTPCPSEACSNYTAPDEIVDDVQDVLFDLATDPSEKINLIEQEPDIAEDLRLRLEEYIVSLPDDLYPDEDDAGDPDNFDGVWSDGWC